ncbi:hypothetical protein EIP91_002667 [Steccherinum ochraceum]|uniref:F-box domain-containing protein n=1 Tax=Steccherinum ochraceum TaxID=92696 RepID=A0A4R0RFF1_9APHY|nr:hypothetical protein EIP91_002667 [Steccherinum ochraceum]
MHRIFYISELVNLIVQHVAARETCHDRNSPGYGHRAVKRPSVRTLRTLGQVARVFREPCLDAKWYHHSGISELLWMVDAIEVVPKDDHDGFFKDHYVTRQLTIQDIPKIQFYSKRIHQMNVSSFNSLRDDRRGGRPREPTETLLNYGPPTLLFPRVHFISYHAALFAEVNFVLNNTGDTLTEMIGNTLGALPPKFLMMAERRRSDLTLLMASAADQESGEFSLGQSLNVILPDARRLVELRVDDDVSHHLNLWDAVAPIPTLRKLSIKSHTNANLLTFGPSCSVTYNNITDLHLQCRSPQAVCAHLQNVVFATLTTLHVHLLSDMNAGISNTEAPVLLSAVSRACADSPLMSLKIYGFESPIDDTPPRLEILGVEHLRPFMKYKLRSLDLSMRWSWTLEGTHLEELATAWGNDIETLKLDPDGFWPDFTNPAASVITLQMLEQFAYSCPGLRILGIPFDPHLSNFVWSDDFCVDLPGHSHLEMLWVGEAPLIADAAPEMAMYLSSVFQKLETVKASMKGLARGQGGTYFEQWQMVSKMLPALHKARRQEQVASFAHEHGQSW